MTEIEKYEPRITTVPEILPPVAWVNISGMSVCFEPGGLANFRDITPVDKPKGDVVE